ncbi:MAG: hypothetical protein ACK5YW_03655 [Betaproteobacteria bacterium]|jgi:hypothetical protein|nr:hypothetical protein [Rhodocyclaceae bacterium]MCA3135039.1 hypothetical protein [Rhodocyclaceae bacterium]MCA3140978.1 hypothetical protein [Rhodocyclaceae bacterium]MCA3146553.1 hypothetical protein [Rhodocyclaceae bacterium]MCE2898449.1 hypothetical protein [Betaproteobacteria bacterium]
MGEESNTHDVAAMRAALMKKLGAQADSYPKAVEARFPRILARIDELWGSHQLDLYLEELMLPERQERQGFPIEVATELLKLIALHGAFNHKPPPGRERWSHVEKSAFEGKPEI